MRGPDTLGGMEWGGSISRRSGVGGVSQMNNDTTLAHPLLGNGARPEESALDESLHPRYSGPTLLVGGDWGRLEEFTIIFILCPVKPEARSSVA